jgi:hypothetical protein
MPKLSLGLGVQAVCKAGGGASGIGFPATVTSSYFGQMQRNSGTTGNQTGTPGFIASKWYYFDNTQYNEENQPYGNGMNIGLTTGNVWYYEYWYWDDGSIVIEIAQSNANPSTNYTSFPTTNWIQFGGTTPGTFTTP